MFAAIMSMAAMSRWAPETSNFAGMKLSRTSRGGRKSPMSQKKKRNLRRQLNNHSKFR